VLELTLEPGAYTARFVGEPASRSTKAAEPATRRRPARSRRSASAGYGALPFGVSDGSTNGRRARSPVTSKMRMEAEPPQTHYQALAARATLLGSAGIRSRLGPGGETRTGGTLGAGAGCGELEPHARAVFVAHAPASGEQLHQL
jgi:hypothetical protein